jgi:hypothetical protein
VHSTSTSLGSANIGTDQDKHKGRFYPYAFLRSCGTSGRRTRLWIRKAFRPTLLSTDISACFSRAGHRCGTSQTSSAYVEDPCHNLTLSYEPSNRGLHDKVSYVSRYERNSKLPFLPVFVRALGAQASGVTLPEHLAPLSRDPPHDPAPVCGSPDHVLHAAFSAGKRPAYNPKYAFYYRLKHNSWHNTLKPTGDPYHCPVLSVSTEKNANLTCPPMSHHAFAPAGWWCSGDGLTEVLQKYLASQRTNGRDTERKCNGTRMKLARRVISLGMWHVDLVCACS